MVGSEVGREVRDVEEDIEILGRSEVAKRLTWVKPDANRLAKSEDEEEGGPSRPVDAILGQWGVMI